MDDDEPVIPLQVKAVYFMLYALLRREMDDADAKVALEAFSTPGAADYWQSLTPAQLEPLRNVTPAAQAVRIGDNLVTVALVPSSAIPEAIGRIHQVEAVVRLYAHVRFLPDLEQWRVERLGDLGPPRLEVLG